jgi:hypothetical protein
LLDSAVVLDEEYKRFLRLHKSMSKLASGVFLCRRLMRKLILHFLEVRFPDVEYARCKKQRLATGLLEQVTAAGVSYRLPTERPSRGIPH